MTEDNTAHAAHETAGPDQASLEELVDQKLGASIEAHVPVGSLLRVPEIVSRARELVDQNGLLSQFATRSAHPDRLWVHLSNAPLPNSVLSRLTFAREKFPTLYDHSLRAAFVALFIGMAARLGERELELLATAALMHDFGMLHADPARFKNDRPLDAAARRQLRAHPLIGMLIAQREPKLNPAIATAILQHHERLDGSGYPSAPPADQLTRLARVLMLVEVVLAMAEHRPHLPELQLSLILRANHRGFDRELTSVVLAALPRIEVEAGPATQSEDSAAKLAQLLGDWEQAKPGKPTRLIAEARRFVSDRLTQLQRFLTEAGIDLHDTRPLEDPAARAERDGLLCEALWHVRQIAFETTMRWPHLAAADTEKPDDAALSEWLRAAAQLAAANSA